MERAARTGKIEISCLLIADGGRHGPGYPNPRFAVWWFLEKMFTGRPLQKLNVTKRRSRFPVGSGTLLDHNQEFPGCDPKLWLIAESCDAFHLLG
jgi:hypothetical protein